MLKITNDNWEENRDLHEEKIKIVDIFPGVCKQLIYSYDMGDSWNHTILWEKQVQTKEKLPKFINGANKCPYENSGSNFGWEEKLRIQKNPKHKYFKETREWLGLEDGEYIDPKKFDLSEVRFSDPKVRLKEWKKELKNFY